MKVENITIGSDPELFLESNNEVVSFVGMCEGTKEKPEPISDEGHSIQVDGVAAEFNIPPCKTKEELISNINFVKEYINNRFCNDNLKISEKVSAYIDQKYLEDPKVRQLGCSSDFNVWIRDVNPSPNAETNLRCVGGHIHIGYDNHNTEKTEDLVKAFDLFLGVPSILIDKDKDRRKLYGKAGAFRFTSFGFEYRVLSNFWIKNDELISWVYDQIYKAVDFVNNNQTIDKKTSELIQKCINNSDDKLAKTIINKYNLICVE